MALGADGASSSSSSNSTRRWKYDVFLSFRGEDTRKNFTDHLYAALERKGIITFRDDEELGRGQVIKPSLLQAIEESFSAVVILSRNYASSTWCLDELEKILCSKKELGLQVFPIFYGVDPSDVRRQRRSFEKAFRKHDEKFREHREKVQRWRNALEEVADISGWHSKDWHETKLIEEVTEALCSKLDPEPLSDPELVGINSKIEEMDSLIMKGLNDVHIIGIWGMGGIGKTTLARAVYEKIHRDFDIYCFLSNIREISEKYGLIHLQRELLSHFNYKRSIEINDYFDGKKWIKHMLQNKKVLIVLDDVSDKSQLENLAVKREWFGPGSKVIITTRDAHLLTWHGVFAKYDIKILSNDESLKLFCQNAFKGDQPTESYLELSRRVVKYAEGLPLALKVLGSFFYGRTECEWKDGLDKLSKIPSIDIMKILKVSYDGLEDAEKNIFLDIACFFKGKSKDWVIGMLKNCGFHPTIGVKVLIEKSMLVDYGNVLEMHDLLQEMGKSIVLQESPNDASKRSRLWTLEDINYVMKKNKGSEVIQSMVLNLPKPSSAYWDPDAFSNMWNLRLLIIRNLNLPCGIKYFPPALKVLQWMGYAQDALPQGVQLDELVDFDMQHSKIKQLWKGTQSLEKLKFINLSHCIDLIRTTNFVGIPNLERLVLEGCRSLVEVHHSLGKLRKLILINLKGCLSLKTLPGKLETDSLETFLLSGCSKVRKLPEFGENMKRLYTLDLEETAIVKLPESLAYLTSLAVLNLRNCKSLLCLPSVLRNLKYLRKINVSGCSQFGRLSHNWNEFKALEELDVSKVAIKKVPSLSGLSLLKGLNLGYCNINDGSLLKGISGLSSLVGLDLSGNNFVNLPVGFISNLLKLKYIDIRCCRRLQSLPELPPNVLTTYAIDCASMEPLLGTQRPRDLFASLDLQQHSQRSSIYEHVFNLALPGKEIPSWFHNQMVDDMVTSRGESFVSFTADIPDYCLSSEWWGIAVCLVLEADKVSPPCPDQEFTWFISWYCGYPKYVPGRGGAPSYRIYEQYNSINQLHIFYIPGRLFSTKRLELQFYIREFSAVHKQKRGINLEIKRCGWRVLCKEDGEGCSNNQQEKENCNKCLELEDPIIYHFTRDHPPNVRTTNASDCASMEPLSETQLLRDLVASIDWKEWPWYPFKLTLIGKKIPSWFHNQNYSFGREMDPSVSMSSAVSVIVDIADIANMPHCYCLCKYAMKIVVCLVLQANIVPTTSFGEPWINWKYYTYGDHEMWDKGYTWGRRPIHEQYNSTHQVHIFYIPAYRFLGKKLIKADFSIEMEQNQGVHKQNMPVTWGIKRCWWRGLCPENIEAWRQTRSEGYRSNIEFASQHLDGFNEVRITEDTHQNQCDHEITEEDGANSYAKHNQQDKGSSNECFEMETNESKLWPNSIVKTYIDIMVEEVTKGNMQNGVFHSKIWVSMKDKLNSITKCSFNVKQMRRKFNRLRLKHSQFSLLLQHTGFGWDAETNIVTADETIWKTYIQAHPDAVQFQKKGCNHYKLLGIIFNRTTVTRVLHHSSTQDPLNTDEENELENRYLHTGVHVNLDQDSSDDVITQTIEHATCKRNRTIQVKERKSKKERRTLQMGDASLAWAKASKAKAEVSLAKDTSSTFISADYSIAKCMVALEEIEDISDDIYNKALEKFTNPDWREMFLTMSNDRKRGWLVRL